MATEYEKKIVSKYLESMPTGADSVTIESVPISVIKAFGNVNSRPLNEPDTFATGEISDSLARETAFNLEKF